MKKLFLLLIPSLSFAAGPIYQHSDELDQQEFNNVYHDIQYPVISSGKATTFNATSLSVSTITAVSSATITNLSVTNLTGITTGKVVQWVAATSRTTFSTTSATYQSTNLSASITPTSASDTILVFASGKIQMNNDDVQVTLFRGSTDLSGSPSFFTKLFAASNVEAPVELVYSDAPATTSSTAYTIKIRNAGGAVSINFAGVQTMILLEVKP